MSNKIHKVGDSMIITIKPKQRGTAIVSSYEDNLIGLAVGKRVKREYRIVEDNLFYSDWKILNNDTIRGIEIKQNNFIQIRYTREGNDSTGEIEFKDITFNGDFKPEVINSPILDSSIFSKIAWSEETEELTKNLFKKLYFRGIIPTYVLRGDNLDVDEDRDYITLFYSIAKYFAILLRFFKRFEDFYNDEELMLEWLRQNEIQFDESTISLSEMQIIARNLYDEIRKRGTRMIFKRKGDVVNGKEIEIDGEFIRLIRNKRSDELLYENIPLYKLGWCLGSSSPLYRGTSFAKNLNKTREDSEDFEDLNNFQTFSNHNSSLSIINANTGRKLGGEKVLKCQTTGNSACGLGRYDKNVEVSNKIYPADPNLDYEITFMFNPILIGNNAKLNFGVEAFDTLKNKLDDALIMPNGEKTTDMFLSQPLNSFRENQWYFVRGIIHAYSSKNVEDFKLNIGFGNNLTFDNKFVKYILPKIYLSSNNSSTLYLWNYKIRPLVRGTNILPLKSGYENSHSMGFIQSPRIFYMYFRNNNNSQSKSEITDIIERYLLPFNVTDILQFIDNE